MTTIVRGPRPDLTPAQAIAGIPILANLLHAFDVFTLSAAQQDSLEQTITYSLALIGGDAIVRTARNYRDARVGAATVGVPGEPRTDGADLLDDDERDLLTSGEELPDDDAELESPPPDDTNTPVQPSQAGLTDKPPSAP